MVRDSRQRGRWRSVGHQRRRPLITIVITLDVADITLSRMTGEVARTANSIGTWTPRTRNLSRCCWHNRKYTLYTHGETSRFTARQIRPPAVEDIDQINHAGQTGPSGALKIIRRLMPAARVYSLFCSSSSSWSDNLHSSMRALSSVHS